MSKKRKISKSDAIAKLWERGELSWKLNDVQKKLKHKVDNDITRTSVVVVSRRTGKTFWLCTEALIQCLKHPNSIVKFLFPKQKDAKINIQPLMREILEDCPEYLKPRYNTQDKIYYFDHNGSQIQLAGSDNGNIESIRGGKAHLCIVDEAGFCSDLKYAIRSVLSPTIRTTKGRIIMASTPSKSPDHEFITEFMVPYKAAGRLDIFTIYDNPNFDQETIEETIADYPLGVEDPDFKREYLCEVAIDTESAVCPEFYKNKKNIIIDEYEVPPYRDFYVGADIGFRDLTVMLFGFYNFKEGTLYITDELVMNGPEMTTDALAEGIKLKEQVNFYHDNEQFKPYLRIMDVDLKLINDLTKLHKITFIPTKKDNKEGAINEMRMWIAQGRVKIHEKCKHLIYHLENGQWNSRRTDFKRLADSPDKTIRGGHVDAIPALYYLIRNVQPSKNPYPFGYNLGITENTFISKKWRAKNQTQAVDFMRKVLNIRKNRD